MEIVPEEKQEIVTPLASRKKSNFSSWWLLGVILGLVILILVVGGVYLKLKKETKDVSSGSYTVTFLEDSTQSLVSGLTDLQIAEKVLGWLDKQRDEGGAYYVSRICNGVDSNCDQIIPSGTSAHYVPSVIWGRFKYYQANPEDDNFQALLRDISFYADESKISTIQNDFWNCGLMFELWESKVFSGKQKEEIESICLRGSYFPSQGLREFLGNEKSIVGLDLKNILNKKQVFEDPLLEEDMNNISKFIAYPFDFATLYLWKKNESDLNKAKYFFNKTAQLYKEEEELLSENDFCTWGVSSLVLSQATGNKDYLDFTESLFDEKIVPGLVEDKFMTPVCAIFANKLFVSTQKENYQEIGNRIEDHLVNKSFDFEGKDGFLVGDGAFFTIKKLGLRGLTKEVRFNGLIIGCLSE